MSLFPAYIAADGDQENSENRNNQSFESMFIFELNMIIETKLISF